MSYPINYPTPQGANVQIFNFVGSDTGTGFRETWVKPQGANFVWFTLIGGGGSGDGATVGGASAAVTNFMCPAFLIPDILQVNVGRGANQAAATGLATTIIYQQKNGAGYTLLTANGGNANNTGGAATAANAFTAMGFYQSIAGQSGASSTVASTTTFLSAGGDAPSAISSNYGYSSGSAGASASGFFMLQPIIVGTGGKGTGAGGIGCGSGSAGTKGGDGLVVIITW